MNADNYTLNGHDHHTCQDYSRSHNGENGSNVVVSDGCSTAKESDWGARLLTMALSKQITDSDYEDGDLIAGHMAMTHARAIGLPLECLRATLLYAKTKKEHIDTMVYGDGVVVARNRHDKSLLAIEYEYSLGAPFYLAYAIQKGSKEQYLKEFGQGKFTRREYTITDEVKIEEVTKDVTDPESGALGPNFDSFRHDTYDLVAVLSDGVKSFRRSVRTASSLTTQEVPLVEVLREIFAFKGLGGAFVQRRCQKAFRGVFHPNGVFNYDDFSMGVIHSE